MTAIGWLQAIVFFLIILALTKPLGSYMARVFAGERTWLSPVLVPVERLDLSHLRRSRRRGDDVVRLRALDAGLLVDRPRLSLHSAAHAEVAAVQPRPHRQHDARLGVEHRGQLYDEHELAVLLRRDGDELSLADGGSRVAQLRLGRRGHRDRRRGRARPRADQHKDARKLLGRPDALLALRPAADLDRDRTVSRVARDAAELPRLSEREVDRGLRAVDHRRPDGIAGSHQGARHQRRRLRQRELVIAQRESERR